MSRGIRISMILILVVGIGAAFWVRSWRGSHALTEEEIAGIPVRLARIPLVLEGAGFRGTREVLEDRIVEMSGADHYAAINYRDGDGSTVRLHVGAATQSEAWFHEPTVCLPTHGWTTSESVLVPIWEDLPVIEPGARVWRMTLHKSGEELIVYYWFQFGEQIVTTRFDRAVRRFRGLLAGEMDQPMQIVILYASVRGGVQETETRVASLVRALWPHLFTVLSQEK